MGLLGLRAAARRARGPLLLLGLVFAVLPAGSALADTTIGQVGFGGGGNPGCGPGVVGDPNYVVPSGRREKITSFSFQSASDNAGQQLDFLVLRSAGGSDYTVIGKSGLVTLKGTGLETFQVSPLIRVGGGDILGWWSGLLHNCFHEVSGRRDLVDTTTNDPNVGDTLSLGGPIDGFDLNESANLATAVGGPPPPTSKAQCRNGGWKNFGRKFKNQGDCVAFFATRGKNPPTAAPVTSLTSCQDLTNSGEYRLDADVSIGNPGTIVNCFNIVARGVALNLNGHVITATGDGVEVDAPNVTILGPGTVTGSGELGGSRGIELFGGDGTVRGVTATNNGVGISIASSRNLIQANNANSNGFGIYSFLSNEVPSGDNTIIKNSAHQNSNWDLYDNHQNCDSNVWVGNDFGTSADPEGSSPSCIQ